MPEFCGNCEYYVGTTKRGKCRRNIPGQGAFGRRINDWPACTYDAWCGEWAQIGAMATVRVRLPGDLDPIRPGPLR